MNPVAEVPNRYDITVGGVVTLDDIEILVTFMKADSSVGVCAPRVIGRSGIAHKTGGLPHLPGDFRRLLRGYQDTRISPDSGQILKQVLGGEEIEVFMRIDVLQFVQPKELPKE